MKKGLIWALLILVLCVVILIFNGGRVDLNLVVTKVSWMKSLVFLGWMAVGVIVGVLLK